MRKLLALGMALSLPALAQEPGNRFGLELGVFQPKGRWDMFQPNGFPNPQPTTGWTGGILVHFNLESRFQGRLRVSYLQTGKGDDIPVSYSANQPLPSDQHMEGRGYYSGIQVGYEVLFHLRDNPRNGPFLVAGLGGAFWRFHTSDYHPVLDPLPQGYYHREAQWFDTTFLPVVGIGWRFNPHWTAETRFFMVADDSRGSSRKGAILAGTYRF